MQRQQVESSTIKSVGFEPGPPEVMEVEFNSGGVYQYRSDVAGVIKQHYDDLMQADSHGKQFLHVKKDPRVKFTKVDASGGTGLGGQAVK